jgi:hypothetical protein
MRHLLAAVVVTGAIGIAAPAVAMASAPPTPDYGLSGACNMTNPNAQFGMFSVAGNHANPNGFDIGMIKAILNSNGGTFPDNCGPS